MKSVMFLLLSYGITNIVVFGSIFEKFRLFWDKQSPNFFGPLFNCPMCSSTWFGFILSTIFSILGYYTPFTEYGIENVFLRIFLDGCFTSGGVWLIHTIQEYFEQRR